MQKLQNEEFRILYHLCNIVRAVEYIFLLSDIIEIIGNKLISDLSHELKCKFEVILICIPIIDGKIKFSRIF
jgi:hypothetical protein